MPMLKITVKDNEGSHAHDLPNDQPVTLGRDEKCGIVLKSEGVSREHCELVNRDGRLFYRDLDSKNGVQLNKKTRLSGEIQASDSLLIGNAVISHESLAVTAASGLSPNVQEQALGDDATPEDLDFAPGQREALQDVTQNQDNENSAPKAENPKNKIVDSLNADLPQSASEGDNKDKQGSKKRLMIIAAVSMALMLGLIILKVVMPSGSKKTGTKTKSTQPQVQVPKTEKERYLALVDKAIDQLENKHHSMARSYVARADQMKVSFSKVGEVLADYIVLVEKGGAKHAYDWDDAEGLLKELEEFFPSTEKIANYAMQQREWQRRESAYRPVLRNVRLALDEKNYVEAMELINKIEGESDLVKANGAMFSRARQQYRRFLRAELAKDEKGESWQNAKSSAEILVGLSQKDEADKLIKKIEKLNTLIKERRQIAAARIHLRNGQKELLQASLEVIGTDSYYASQANSIRKGILEDDQLVEVRKLYKEGKVNEALVLCEDMKGEAAKTQQAHMKRVINMFNLASQALITRETNKAVELWRKLLDVETDTENFFSRESTRALKDWTDSAYVAKRYMTWANEDADMKNYKIARSYYNKAAAADPNGLMGEQECRAITRQGILVYNKGLAVMKTKPADAKKHFYQALDMLPEDHDMVPEVKKYLVQLKK